MPKRNPDIECLPELSLAEREAELVWSHYRMANVILEYGSGGSSVMASTMPGKLVVTVESDLGWQVKMRRTLEACAPPSLPIFYHVDIGPTGPWGRPVDARYWKRFHTYPMQVWDEPWFRHPDVVLIDGRFRPACLATVLMRATRPVTVLFDDYVKRPVYHAVERYIRPTRKLGRMAVFEVPGVYTGAMDREFFELFVQATYSSMPNERYS